jgi:hypothetical protein
MRALASSSEDLSCPGALACRDFFQDEKHMNHPAQAAVLRSSTTPMAIEAVEIAEPQPDEILVQIAGVGVCHTDMVMRDGLLPVPQPVVLGHEGAGRVIAVGSAVRDVAAIMSRSVFQAAAIALPATCMNRLTATAGFR